MEYQVYVELADGRTFRAPLPPTTSAKEAAWNYLAELGIEPYSDPEVHKVSIHDPAYIEDCYITWEEAEE